MLGLRKTGLAVVALLMAWWPVRAMPDGFVVYSKGDASSRTLTYRTLSSSGNVGAEQTICEKGSIGGDISCQISFDGTWLAFSRSLGGADKFGGDDYHSFDKWEICVVPLDKGFPATPSKVAKGYFPCWGEDSDNATKTLYFSVAPEGKATSPHVVKKVTIDADGSISTPTTHVTVNFSTQDPHMSTSPNGKYVAIRSQSLDKVYLYSVNNGSTGGRKTLGKGCHTSFTADNKWCIHAFRQAWNTSTGVRSGNLRSNKGGTAPDNGSYHFGHSADVKWFVSWAYEGGDSYAQNLGRDVHLYKFDTAIGGISDKEPSIIQNASWPDIHVGEVDPVRIGATAPVDYRVRATSAPAGTWWQLNGRRGAPRTMPNALMSSVGRTGSMGSNGSYTVVIER